MVTTVRMIPEFTHTCQACGTSWTTLKAKPETCRRCKSYQWMVPAKQNSASE